MRKLLSLVLIPAFVLTSAFAQPSAIHADANSAAESEIKNLEMHLAEIVVQGDWEEYAKHLSPDYLHTSENGQVESKDQTMEALRDVKRQIIVMEIEPASLAIRVYGDTAIANAEFTLRVRDAGQVKSRRIRQTNVFLKRDAQWLLVATQNTTIAR